LFSLGLPWQPSPSFAPLNNSRDWKYLSSEIVDQPGVPGQGGVFDPPGYFDEHYIVKYGILFYDPSYGNGRMSAQEWEDTSIAGFINKLQNGTQVAAKNTPGIPEMKFNDFGSDSR
jgi:hypothetical protein